MALVLAIVPAHERGPIFDELTREFSDHEFVSARMTSDAFAVVGSRIPDLVVFPLSLFPTEKAALVCRLNQWSGGGRPDGSGAAVSSFRGDATETNWFYWFKPRRAEAPATVPSARVATIVTTTAAAMANARRAFVAHIHALGPIAARAIRLTATISVQVARIGGRRAARVFRALVIVAGVLARAGAHVFRASSRFGASGLARLGRIGMRTLREGYRVAAGIRIPPAETRRKILIGTAVPITAVVVLIAGRAIVRRVEAARSSVSVAVEAPQPAVTATPVAAKRSSRGRLKIGSEPEGAAVTVDGQPRGIAPVVVEDLTAGAHTVVLSHGDGSVRETVRVKANETTTFDGAIYSGWVALFAPFELQISDGGRLVILDEHHQAMLSPGTHELRLSNSALGYSGAQTVVVRPGEVSSVSVAPPKTAVTLTATTSAEVWIDGTKVGETPLVDFAVPIGTREFVLKSATLGERRVVTTVTMKPLHIEIDFTKPDAGA